MTTQASSKVDNTIGAKLWFSDGESLDAIRGGLTKDSSRLIVDNQHPTYLNLNGHVASHDSRSLVKLNLTIPANGSFSFSLSDDNKSVNSSDMLPIFGMLKPLPKMSDKDAAFIDEMIASKYIPYQNITDAPGKPVEEIKALGQRFFPFSPPSNGILIRYIRGSGYESRLTRPYTDMQGIEVDRSEKLNTTSLISLL